MTELRFEEKIIPSVDLSGESPLPAMRNALSFNLDYETGDEAGLFIGYGLRTNALPSKLQDRYNTEIRPQVWKTAVLENEYLKATFIPDLGGRLWSLYDKEKKRDLLTENPVVKPGNLAICNAWCSGGVEWNIGTRGHHVRTCRSMFVARARSYKGSPVLRMYEFSRENGVAYQMEFFLPEGSRFLFLRTRIHNHHSKVIPMYWWSNIAVDEGDDLRVVTPATHSFANTYISNFEHILRRVELPTPDGYDCTYPKNYPVAKDHFFQISARDRKFEAALYGDGWGLCQCSTDILKGRKLFVWGRSSGGLNWQKRLTSPEGRPYVEIQAGLANTQLECMPMPPRTAWEWVEAYGALQTDPEKIHGSWEEAKAETEARLEEALPRQVLEDMLAETKTAFALQEAEEIISRGSGWGALEKARCGANSEFAPQLDFDSDDTETRIWQELLAKGAMPEWNMAEPPPSYMVQDEFYELLKAAPAGKLRDFQMGINCYFRKEYDKAEEFFTRAGTTKESFAVAYAVANTRRCKQDFAGAEKAFRDGMGSGDPTLIREGLQAMCEGKLFESVIECYENLSDDLKAIPMNKIYYITALLHTGRPEEAEGILMENGGLEVPQLREGEGSLSNLYAAIQCAKAEKNGVKLNPESVEVPNKLDFRMDHISELGKFGSRYGK
ncbi:MAG: DUF5107 domain-containing protein [Lentisphaerae bacterium]|nr:DUF5107 domain-containing protein [Lentisphaerota bacterium]